MPRVTETLLVVSFVLDRHCLWIVEDSDRVDKLDAVLAQVGTLFVGSHSNCMIARSLCAFGRNVKGAVPTSLEEEERVEGSAAVGVS
jgi:hypothetical protein